jgi:NAD(P)-dependent dehydrogenase (short-subunit alcohol dehydrogenase family)
VGGALLDRRVLVTGAAQGLGLGIARRLAAAGAQLAVTDRDCVILDRAREPTLEAATIPIVKDLAAPDSAEYVFSQISQRLGSVNVLVNCAAWSLQKAVGETTVEEFDELIAINQRAPFFLCQKFVGQLMEGDSDPCIINIASVNAIVGET